MDIIQFVKEELIRQQENDAIILEIFKTGSQLFIEAPHDLDYVIILKNFYQRRRKVFLIVDGVHYDFIFISEEGVNSQLDFNKNHYIGYKIKLFNYFYLLRNVIYGKFDINWNMLDHRQEYFEYIKTRYKETVGSRPKKSNYNYGKGYAPYYTILTMFLTNTTTLSDITMTNIANLYNKQDNYKELIDWVIEQMALI